MNLPANILLSRNDGIGDMVLMLPMAGIIKANYPHIKIAVLGKKYTKALVDACVHVDEFIDEEDYFSKEILIGGLKPATIIHVRTNKKVAQRARLYKYQCALALLAEFIIGLPALNLYRYVEKLLHCTKHS